MDHNKLLKTIKYKTNDKKEQHSKFIYNLQNLSIIKCTKNKIKLNNIIIIIDEI